MAKLQNKHKRRSIRLKGYDYSQAGAYFVTICTHYRKCLFGDVVDNEMILSKYGMVVKEEWELTGKIRPNIEIDEFQVMPNHLHGIIMIHDVGAHCNVPLHQPATQSSSKCEQFKASTKNSIPTIVKLFKASVTSRINEMRNTPGEPVWQCNYYEHVIRDEGSLDRLREYIVNNPFDWPTDEYNPNVKR